MKPSRLEKYNSGKIATATAVATLFAIGITYGVDDCAVDKQDNEPKSEKKFGGMKPDGYAEYIYKNGDAVEAGIVAVNGSCDLYTKNVAARLELGEEVAPDGLVYPGKGIVPMLPCADLDPKHLPPRVTLLIK